MPAVEPSPVEPIVLLVLAAAAAVELAAVRSEKRLVVPRVAPRLVAVMVETVEPVVSDEDVLTLVLVDVIVVVEAATPVAEVEALEEFEVVLRDDTRLPLWLPRFPRRRGATIAENRSAWIVPPSRTLRRSSPKDTTAVRAAVAPGPPPVSGCFRCWLR